MVKDNHGEPVRGADSVGRYFALAEDGSLWSNCLEQQPGAELLGELLAVDLSSLGEGDLAAGVGALGRMSRWLAWFQTRWVAELQVRARAAGESRTVVASIASELEVTRHAAEGLVVLADAVAQFPRLGLALRDGVVDAAKAEDIYGALLGLDKTCHDAVVDLGLALAPGRTRPQLRAALAGAVAAMYPQAADERAQQAREQRRVEFTASPEMAMAWVAAYLPAADAVAVRAALDGLAATQHPGDGRTLDQRRADVFAGVFQAILADGAALVAEPGAGSAVGHGSAADPTGITDSTSTADPASGVRDGSAFGLGGAAAPDGPSASCPQAPVLRWQRLSRPRGGKAQLQVTVAASTLLGLDDFPGHLAGFGPVPPDVARAIAEDATWRVVLTDPKTGQVAHIGDESYRPGAVLGRLVSARDQTCVFPGCRQPAHRCDIDHREPFDPAFPAIGQTHAGNLQLLCRFHHQLKTHEGWFSWVKPDTGDTAWLSPYGRYYRREPEPALAGLAPDVVVSRGVRGVGGTGPPGGAGPPSGTDPPGDPPPF